MRDVALLALASRQHGLVERNQAVRLGVDDDGLARRVAGGLLIRAHPGVYRVAGAPITREQRLLAACLAAGPDTAVSHRSAAHEWLLGEFPDVVEIVTPRAQWPRLQGVRVHRSHDLVAGDVTLRHGLPITKPLRTLVDLGQSAPWAVPDGLERGLTAKLFSLAAADAAIERHSRKGRTGVGVFRAAVDQRALARNVPESMLEVRFARLCRTHGLPTPAYQHWITPEIRVDFAYVQPKIAVEVDGFGVHGTSHALTTDLARQNHLVLLGWTVLRFTWIHVVKHPDQVARTVLVTLTRGIDEPP